MALLAIVGTILNSAWFKGIIGEYKVNSLIEGRLDKENYRIIKNVLLPTEDGSTQIDHIVVSRFGIFVIETKNISNWIFANVGPFWTQVIFKRKYKFQNPSRQNYKHVKVLEKLLRETEKIFINTVVFVGNCEFKTDMPNGVVKLNGLIPHIKSYQNQIFGYNELDEYVRKIERYKLENTIKNKIKHIQHVEDIMLSKGYDGGSLERNNRKFAYKILLAIIFLLIVFSFLDKIPSQSSKIFSNIVKNNIEQQNKIKQKENSSKSQQYKQIPSQYEERQLGTGSNVNQEIKTKAPSKYRDAIYSWTNESGQRVFSNVGFPKDKPYTDAKIEWR
ncbi:MAG: nuclease-related domain-containing protein [Desulfobulbus sp.]|nr:nuclease-related domain-containing protein [Desulfobulbus sp.]